MTRKPRYSSCKIENEYKTYVSTSTSEQQWASRNTLAAVHRKSQLLSSPKLVRGIASESHVSQTSGMSIEGDAGDRNGTCKAADQPLVEFIDSRGTQDRIGKQKTHGTHTVATMQ